MTNAPTKSYERDKVIQIIGSVIDKVEKDNLYPRDVISRELIELRQVIEQMRAEVVSMYPNDIGEKDIPSATDQLDAITDSIGKATAGIMDDCEGISQIAETLDESSKSQLLQRITSIYEHCTFHDLTTQRINKIVGTLKTIEDKVQSLTSITGTDYQTNNTLQVSTEPDPHKDPLLNGPQLPGEAMSQDEIDKLLSEFDD
jgi:chemotaxis protein CheZ